MSTTGQYNIGTYQATTGFSSDTGGKLTDTITSIGNGYEQTGGSTSGSTAQITALYDLGASPAPISSIYFAVAYERTPTCVLEYASSLSGPWTSVTISSLATGSGTFTSYPQTISLGSPITARYWRLSIQDTADGLAASA